MTVFGHGDNFLPSPKIKFSHGSDPWKGPPCCRGQAIGCEYGPDVACNDHCCCCDPCRHETVPDQALCTGLHCCKCIPKALCAVFTPDDYGDGGGEQDPLCKPRGWIIYPQHGTAGRSTYSQGFTGIGLVTISVGLPVYGDTLLSDYDNCSWKFELEDTSGYENEITISEEYEIDHAGDVNCLAPPTFTLENVNLQLNVGCDYPIDCYGTIVFSEYTESKIPFFHRWDAFENTPETQPSYDCSSCSEVCTNICVKRSDITQDDGYTRDDFVWDGDSWTRGSYEALESISMYEDDYGQCYLDLDGINGVFQGDLIEITECNVGMDLTATDDLGNWIKVSCNVCSCWKHVCGTCRCACTELCVVNVVDNEVVISSSTWDRDENTWDGFTLGADENDNCIISSPEFSDSSPIDNDCGSEIGFLIEDDLETQLYTGNTDFVAGWCKGCAPCNAGTCLEACEEVPQVLQAYVEPADWNLQLGCDDYSLCFDPVTIPLVLRYVATTDVAGEWRWIGKKVISCHGCDTGGNPGWETDNNYLVEIDLGCDGSVNFSVTGDPVANVPCAVEDSFELPCGCDEIWDLSFTFLSCGDMICCNEAGFIVSVTE